MERYVLLRGGSCKAYWRLCELLRPLRMAYVNIAEKELNLTPSKELDALVIASRFQREPVLCHFSKWILDHIGENSACILGPLLQSPVDCDGLVMGVEQSVGFSDRLDLVTGDLDGLNRRVLDPTVAKYWLVHIHGDNIPLLMSNYSLLGENVIFTNQRFCSWPVVGIGGFTDGDRLILLSMAMGIKEVRLVGFDFSSPKCVGKVYCDLILKNIKLNISLRLINMIANRFGYHSKLDTENNILFIKSNF